METFHPETTFHTKKWNHILRHCKNADIALFLDSRIWYFSGGNFLNLHTVLFNIASSKILPYLTCLKLRLPYRNDAKIAKICNLWTFCPVNLTALFTYMERWAKRLFVGF